MAPSPAYEHDPSDEIGRLFDALIQPTEESFTQSLVDSYHALCTETARRECPNAVDPQSRKAIAALITAWEKTIYAGRDFDRTGAPERCPEQVQHLHRCIIEPERRYAFYSEIKNAYGEWLLFTDAQCYRYARGAAAMRILTARDPERPYAYNVLLSPPAFEEDVERILERGMGVRYEEPASLVFNGAYAEVEKALAKDQGGEIFHVTARREGVRATLSFETSDGAFLVIAERGSTATVRYTCTRTGPSPASADTRAPRFFEMSDTALSYHALCWKNGSCAGSPVSQDELSGIERLRQEILDDFSCCHGHDIQPELELPMVTQRNDGRKEIAWLLCLIDHEGLTTFHDGRRVTIFREGPVAYRISAMLGREDTYRLQTIYSPEAFREELELIRKHGAALLEDRPEFSELLEMALYKTLHFGHRARAGRMQIRFIDLDEIDSVPLLRIHSSLRSHQLRLELDKITRTVAFKKLGTPRLP